MERAERGSVAGEGGAVLVLGRPRGRGWVLLGPARPTPEAKHLLRFPGPHLADELAALAHADVLLTLGSLDAHAAPERVRLYYELGWDGGGGERPLSSKAAGPGGGRGPSNRPDLRTRVGSTGRLCSRTAASTLTRGRGTHRVRLAGRGPGLTKLVAVLGGGGDATPRDLHVLAAGPAVQLVLADLPPAQLVSHGALVPHILVKIRRRVILPLCGYQGKNSVNLLWATPPPVHRGEGCRGECGRWSWEAEVQGEGGMWP